MKSLLTIFICLVLIGFVYADVDERDGVSITTSTDMDGFSGNISEADGQTVKSGGTTYPDIIHFWTMEDNADDYWDASKDCSDHDTTPSLSGAIINTDAVQIGTYGLDMPTTYDRADFDGLDVDSGSLRIGFYAYIIDWQDNHDLFRLHDGAGVGTDIIVWMEGSDELEFYAGGQIFDTSGCNLVINTQYFIEVALDDTNNDRDIYVDGSLCGGTDAAWTGNTTTTITLGTTHADGGDWYSDNFMISDDPTRDFNAIKTSTSKPSGACNG